MLNALSMGFILVLVLVARVIVGLLGIYAFLLAISGVWKIVEMIFYEKKTCRGIVEKKYFVEERTYSTDMMVGDVYMPVHTTHAAEWHVHVLAPEISGDVRIQKDEFNIVHERQVITLRYDVNRITRSRSLTGIAA